MAHRVNSHLINTAFYSASQHLINDLFVHSYTRSEFVSLKRGVLRLMVAKYRDTLTESDFQRQ